MRPGVQAFAEAMEAKLAKNEGKGGWALENGCSLDFLFRRLRQELKEYSESDNPEELVDIANFCMMLWTRQTLKDPKYFK